MKTAEFPKNTFQKLRAEVKLLKAANGVER